MSCDIKSHLGAPTQASHMPPPPRQIMRILALHDAPFDVASDESVWALLLETSQVSEAAYCVWRRQGQRLWIRHVQASPQHALWARAYARHWAHIQDGLTQMVEAFDLAHMPTPYTPMSWAQQVLWGAKEDQWLHTRLRAGAQPWRAQDARTLLLIVTLRLP